MTDAEYAIQRQRVEACFNHWLWRMRVIGVWQITFHWIRHHSIKIPEKAGIFDEITHFETVTDWDRLTAGVAVYLQTIDDLNDDELSRAILEEIVHILINEMREWRYYDERTDDAKMFVSHEERVAAWLVRSIWALTNEPYEAEDAINAGWPWPARPMADASAAG